MSTKLEPITDRPLRIAIIGAGQRGEVYASYARLKPHLCEVIAVAEPLPKSRSILASSHSIPPELCFTSHEALFSAASESPDRLGIDAVVVTVQDKMHWEVVERCTGLGFRGILCEKPLAVSEEDCVKIENAVRESGAIFGVGHVLRYSPYSRAITSIIRSNKLGQPLNIVHVEPVGHFHFAHSYVRGPWSVEEESSFGLMTKSCHDIDILSHWLSPAVPTRVSSFGSLSHFKKALKPSGAGSVTKCVTCPVEKDCAYSAKRIYLDPVSLGYRGWPASTIVDGVPDIENITSTLSSTRYGTCVYELSNDIVDNQVVNLEFSSGATISFTMVAFTSLICERQTRIHFPHGEIVGDMSSFELTDFRTAKKERHGPFSDMGGHGGGDMGLIEAFVRAVREGDQEVLGTTVEEAVRSHLCVFAAERSRREGRVVDVEGFGRKVREDFLDGKVASRQ